MNGTLSVTSVTSVNCGTLYVGDGEKQHMEQTTNVRNELCCYEDHYACGVGFLLASKNHVKKKKKRTTQRTKTLNVSFYPFWLRVGPAPTPTFC